MRAWTSELRMAMRAVVSWFGLVVLSPSTRFGSRDSRRLVLSH
jgi:hypothetical protein